MALEGTLRDVGLSDIFQLLHLQQKTGILTVFRDKELVTVCFEKGQVVFADEFQRSEQERLGAVLLKSKLITAQQLLKAVEMQKQTLQKLGFVLVNNGFLSQDQLKRALQMQVRESIFKLFRWEDGQFKFSQEPVAYDPSLYSPMPSDFLVMEGIRRIDEWPLIKKKVPGMDVIFDRTEEALDKIGEAEEEKAEGDLDDILSFVDDGGALDKPQRKESQGLRLSSSERVVFALLDGKRSVQDLVDESRIGEFETCKAIFSLLALGLVRKVGEAAVPEAGMAAAKRPFYFKRTLAFLAVAAAACLLLLFNPLSPVRGWGPAQSTLDEMGRVGDDLRLEKIKFALLCYYLEREAYPSRLDELAQVNLLEARDIYDHRGDEFSYLREQDGYSLRSSPEQGGEEP